MIRTIETATVRRHTLSDRGVRCPNTPRYGCTVKPGWWVQYRESYVDGTSGTRVGRVLGRVDAPASGDIPAIVGHVSVLALSDLLTYGYIRWIAPEDILEATAQPPARLLAWITGPLPTPDLVHRLADYGTVSEEYIDNSDHHIRAWKAGVSPAAWDAGVRK